MMKMFDVNTKVSAFFLGAVCLSVSSCAGVDEGGAVSDKTRDTAVSGVERVSISDDYSLNYGYSPYYVDPVTGRQIRPEDKDLRIPSSIVVCRSKKCAPALSNMSTEFLYNAYYNLLENNVGTNVMLCSADSTSRVCYEPFISFDVSAGIAPATVAIDAVRIVDLGMVRGNQAVVPVLDYSIYANGIRTKCTPSAALGKVKSPNYMVIDGLDSQCRFTATGNSVMSIVFTVDYIDFDYGIVGASYSVGVSGTTSGGGKGYALLKFKNPVTGTIINETCEKDKNACERRFDSYLPNDNKFFTRCDGTQNVSSVYPYSCGDAPVGVQGQGDGVGSEVPYPARVSSSMGASVESQVVASETYPVQSVREEVAVQEVEEVVEQRPETGTVSAAEDKSFFSGWFDDEEDSIRMKYAIPLDYDNFTANDNLRFAKEGRNIRYEDFANRAEPKDLVIISPPPRNVAK